MRGKLLSAFSIFGLSLGFYLATLLPSMAWGDGIKLQSEAVSGESFVLAEMSPAEFRPDSFVFARVGVAAWDHPLYIVMGNLLVQAFPDVDALWLVNLISAVCGAGTVGLVFLLCQRYTHSLPISAFASLSLAVSHTFWWHSATPEVYTLFACLFLLSFYFFDRFESTRRPAALGWSGFFWGLAASTHILAALALPALGLYFLLSRNDPRLRAADVRSLAWPGLGFLAGFSLYILQFLRMSASFPPDKILGPVVGSTFLSQLGSVSPGAVGVSLLTYLFFLTVQFGPVGVLLGSLGMCRVFGDPPLRKLIAFFLVFALFGVFYRVTDQFTFFIPSYLFWAMLMALGLQAAFRRIPASRHRIASMLLGGLLLATPLFYVSLPALAERNGLTDEAIGIPRIGAGVRDGLAYYLNPDKRGDRSAFDFGHGTVTRLPPDAIVVAEWYTDTDEYFILRYFTRIARLRPDVTVLGWPSLDPFSFDRTVAEEAIETSFLQRPVYLASLSERFYGAAALIEEYCIIRENNLYRLHPRHYDGPCLGPQAVTE